jgi:hypothetical protein
MKNRRLCIVRSSDWPLTARTIQLLNRAIGSTQLFLFEVYMNSDFRGESGRVPNMERVDQLRGKMLDNLTNHEVVLEADKRSR